MVHSCPQCGVFLSFQRKEMLNPDLISGHWYGCPGCARNVCEACGKSSGRRCLQCGDTLEPDQFFPVKLKPREDWRSIVSAILEEPAIFDPVWVVELISCVTETSIHDIDAALDEWTRNRIRDEVFALDILRRLGSTDSCTFIHATEHLWTPEWEQRLSVAAGYYLERADDLTRDALRQRELLQGWLVLAPASRPAGKALLELTLHPDEGVSDLALRVQHLFELPLLYVLEWCVPVLRSGVPARVSAALAVLENALERHSPLDRKTRQEVEQRLCSELAKRGESEVKALVSQLVTSSLPWPVDVVASFVGALDLAGAVLPLLAAALSSRRPGRYRIFDFIAAMGTSAVAAGARALILEHLERAESHDVALPCLRALGRMGTPARELLTLARKWTDTGPENRRKGTLRTLIQLLATMNEGESEELRALCQRLMSATQTIEDRQELLQLVTRLHPSMRRALFPGLPEPAELLLGLFEENQGTSPCLANERLLELHHESPRLRAWLINHVMEEPDDALSSHFFNVAGPECGSLLLLLQRLIADRSARLFLREEWVKALGRIAPDSGSPALRVLYELFLDARERLPLRITAAQTLWSVGVRGLPGTELALVLRDRSASLRAWGLLLAAEVEEGLLASLREDPVALVRQLAIAGSSWLG
ncbi:hypothetical protein F0U61_43340 [Archangium violaceum]|uniref:hypothetical protein n=1 Tax=Archangium violaceum TaxID=83451 RepID=UPI002B2F9873|nr:hypothetical protein F0U61_43340 [Archangium violaceum]